MIALDVSVTLRGGLFEKNIDRVVEQALVGEVLTKVDERLMRKGTHGSGGQGIGVRRNIVTRRSRGLELDYGSTRRNPRNTGKAWLAKNVRIVKAMAPRVIRKAALRMAAELAGAPGVLSTPELAALGGEL